MNFSQKLSLVWQQGYLILAAILTGGLIALANPVLIIAVLAYAGIKLRDSEALLACCSGYPTRKVVVYGRFFG